MDKEQILTKKELREELGEFAEKILLPAMEKIVDERIEAKVPPMINTVINRAKLEIMDHVDDKVADLRGDIILLLRKEDRRVHLLIDKLRKKNILEDGDVKELEEMRVFIQA